MAIIFLTALRESPSLPVDRAVPKVVSIDTANVKSVNIDANSTTAANNLIVKVSNPRYRKTYRVAERLGEYLMLTDFNNSASSPLNNGVKALTIAASGAGAASVAQSLSAGAYFNSITAATVSTMTGVRLPNASTTGRRGTVMVVQNAASTSIIVFPAASESLNSSTAGAVTISPGTFKNFYCSTTAAWQECDGPVY